MYSVDRSSIFFYVHVQLFQHHLLKRLYSVHQITVILFSKISCSCVWIYLWILYSVSLIFFFFILMLILYHTLLVTIALWWVLKSDGVGPLTVFFWKTFLPSHQKTKLECTSRVLVLVLCLVRDLRESPKTIVPHPRHLCLVLTAVLETPWNPESQSVWIKWSCLVARELESVPKEKMVFGTQWSQGGPWLTWAWVPLSALCWPVMNWPNKHLSWGVRIWNADRGGVREQWMITGRGSRTTWFSMIAIEIFWKCRSEQVTSLLQTLHWSLCPEHTAWAQSPHCSSSCSLSLRSPRLPLDVSEPLLCTLPF